VKKSNLMLGAALVAAFGAGLAWSFVAGGSQGGVAVIDLDRVAHELGKDVEIVNSFQSQAGALQQQLNAAQQKAAQELKQIRAGLGETPSEEDAKKFLLTQQTVQVNLNKMRNQAGAMLTQHRQQIVSDFRESTKPIVSEVARDKGLATVMTRNDAVVFAYDDAVDITDEVIARLRATMPQIAESTSSAVQQVSAEQPADGAAPVTTAAAEEIVTE